MIFKALDVSKDKVIDSQYITVKTDCEYAIKHLVPLINKYDMQRNPMKASFYAKLEEDLKKGCIMPPLTIAFSNNNIDVKNLKKHIGDAFVLDGIQRLNTLKRIGINNLILETPIFLNVLICDSMDKLLYRMITLNNGQKPMSARHQVEILTQNIFYFDDLNLPMQTEKESRKKQIRGSFKREVIVRSYLAFISESINIDNQKIIEEKLDSLVTRKIMDSNIPERENEFSDVIDLINSYCEDTYLKKWFKVDNNIVAFCAGINHSINYISKKEVEDFKNKIEMFESVMQTVDVSKVKLGSTRRKLVNYFIQKYEQLYELDELDFQEKITTEV